MNKFEHSSDGAWSILIYLNTGYVGPRCQEWRW